jgi:hypothetical protein
VPRYRVTSKNNPSERFEDDFDDVLVVRGMWIFARSQSAEAAGAGQSFGNWAVADHTVEIEEHGGVWRDVDPDTLQPTS